MWIVWTKFKVVHLGDLSGKTLCGRDYHKWRDKTFIECPKEEVDRFFDSGRRRLCKVCYFKLKKLKGKESAREEEETNG